LYVGGTTNINTNLRRKQKSNSLGPHGNWSDSTFDRRTKDGPRPLKSGRGQTSATARVGGKHGESNSRGYGHRKQDAPDKQRIKTRKVGKNVLTKR